MLQPLLHRRYGTVVSDCFLPFSQSALLTAHEVADRPDLGAAVKWKDGSPFCLFDGRLSCCVCAVDVLDQYLQVPQT